MNYLTEIREFYDWLELNPLSSSAINLWHALMHINNKAKWIEEFTVSINTLELKTGLKRSSIYRARNQLKQYGRIDFKERNSNLSSVYRVFPFGTQSETQNGTQSETQNGTQNGIQSGTINKQNKTKPNIKKVSKGASTFDEIIDAYTENETLRFELKEHLKTRKAKKATLTDRAIELACSSLDKLAQDDETKIAIVRQSIANGWIGFFALKMNYNVPQQQVDNDPDRIVKILQAAEKRGEL